MLNKKTIKSIQEKILNSQEFTGSKVNKKLLNFLIKSYLKNETPKESTIASEIFNRNANFNPNEDTIVRVRMHSLRNKLESYYKTEGANEKIRLHIPRGNYTLEFISTSQQKDNGTPLIFYKDKNFFIIFIAVLFISFAVFTTILWQKYQKVNRKLECYEIVDEKNPIWGEYLQSNLPMLIVLGNHLFYSEYSEELQRWRYVRDLIINTPEELEHLKVQYPEKQIIDNDEAYFPDGSVWSIPPVLKLLHSVQKPIELRRVKDITPQSLYSNNIIFLGSIKTLGIFDQYFSGSHFSYELIPHTPFRTTKTALEGGTIDTHRILYTPVEGGETDTVTTSYNQSTGYHRDLALALKFPGPNNNSIFIITSFYSSGVPEVAKYLCRPETLNELEQQFIARNGNVPPYFEILFEVRGVMKTGFHLEIKYLNEINKDVDIW